MTNHSKDAPLIIDIDDTGPRPSPADAPPVAEVTDLPTGQAMQSMATLAARRGSVLGRWFWRLLLALVVFVSGLFFWDFVTGLVARNPVLGYAVTLLLAAFVLVCLALVIRELAALARLKRVDGFQIRAAAISDANNIDQARSFAKDLQRFYKGRADLSWGQGKLTDALTNSFDVDTVLTSLEDTLLLPLDTQAQREVEAAARQVATVTALVPLAFADVIAALTANVRMIRRIAEVYGGRAGTLGSWRLTRAVITHLVATGAVAVGDDLLGSLGGGTLLSKISRRFGEGLVNGALTARVGIAAMEVCRPMAFSATKRPSVTGIVRRALTGLFDKKEI